MKNEKWDIRRGVGGNLEICVAGASESMETIAMVPYRPGRKQYQMRVAKGIAMLPDLIRVVDGLHHQLVVLGSEKYSSLETLELLHQGNVLIKQIGRR